MANPLISDRNVDFLLHEVLRAEELLAYPYFADHSKETFELALSSARKLAREVLWPAYKPMDEAQTQLKDGQVHVHPAMREIYAQFAELGLTTATRPAEVGGQQLPLLVTTLTNASLIPPTPPPFRFLGLTIGSAHLIEAFGTEQLKRTYMRRMYDGRWTGTMALTEPQAGSSLSDVQTKARPTADGHYLLSGNKVFISGGDHDFGENIVHLALARIEGAPAGTKGISLFCVPKKRPAEGADLDAETLPLVDNDCTSAGVFHKLGWRGLPSIALNFGERGDCRGWLVGEPNRGLSYMFQMMNEARLMVGLNGVATASAAFHESLEYAKTRPQGRPLASRDLKAPQIPIVQHADVRRMLLRQKAIVEGGLSLIAWCARAADDALRATDEDVRTARHKLLDLLTPVAKTFPAEKGFEANALALQIHGGYGYTSEYLPESWLRDQKLNTLHEGTTTIQGLDLLGRKVVEGGGASLQALAAELGNVCERAIATGDEALKANADALQQAIAAVGALTMELGSLGLSGDRDGMMRHSADYLELFSIVVIAWQWLLQATVATEALAKGARGEDNQAFYRGKKAACAYWFAAELPRVAQLAALCQSGERSYEDVKAEEL
ncbi:MAG: acyl-CoA dehydrogenase [Deltaproteobacteria bacterium]|nr:acyl-CoA dehydrogenase [Deltaproteobacteria bacterium]